MIAETSRLAYQSIKELGNKQRQVYDVIKEYEPVTNEQIADLLGWSINRITGRVNELAKMGYVVQHGYGRTRAGRTAKQWVTDIPLEVKEQMKMEQGILFSLGLME